MDKSSDARTRLAAPVSLAALFSAAINGLMLTGPIFLLQLYDRVLPSRSAETLVVLLILVLTVYAFVAVLDCARTRILARIAAQVQAALDPSVFVMFRPGKDGPADGTPAALAHVDAVRTFIASSALTAIFDIPFAPLFLISIFVLHPGLGWLTAAGASLMAGATVIGHRSMRDGTRSASASAAEAAALAADAMRSWDDLTGLGMTARISDRWLRYRAAAQRGLLASGDRAAAFGAALRAFRLALQSALMALGAWIVIRDGSGAGAMMAASILAGRALAPIDQISAQWPVILRASTGWQALRASGVISARRGNRPHSGLDDPPAELPTGLPQRMVTERSPADGRSAYGNRSGLCLTACSIAIIPPGSRHAAVRDVSFTVLPGQALAVIGPSGSGKSSLARGIAGAWPIGTGTVTLDPVDRSRAEPGTAALPEQSLWRPAGRGGYLPQHALLLPGSAAENISGFLPGTGPAAITLAARLAGVHDLILALPDGYQTRLGTGGHSLSGGQTRLIGLARALCGDPMLLVLDEPDAHLDQIGRNAMRAAIRQVKARGGVVVVTAHTAAATADCEQTLVLDGGRPAALGPTAAVLQSVASVGTRPAVARVARGARA